MSDENKLSLAEFVPAKAELQMLVEKSKNIDVKDIALVHDTRIGLRDARLSITKKAKEMRDGAIQFQKMIIQKEKEFIAIVEPEEERLSVIEGEAKLRKEMELRREELPTRIAALETVGDGIKVSDDELLVMDDNEFNAYRLRRIEAKLLKDKEEAEIKRRQDEDALRKQREEEDRLRREKLDAEESERRAKMKVEEDRIAAEKAKMDVERAAIEAAKKAQEEEINRKEREAKLEKERVERETEEKRKIEEQKKKEEEDRKKLAKYQEWLKSVDFDEAKGDIVLTHGDIITAYKKVGEYKI